MRAARNIGLLSCVSESSRHWRSVSGLRSGAGPVAVERAPARAARRRDVPRIDRGPGHQVRDPRRSTILSSPSTRSSGTARFASRFDGRGGYLQSALQALDIPVESQMLVFSATSLQARLINPGNPRALFFNDRVVLGYVRNGEILEVAAQDATEGIVFYTLEQKTGRRAAVSTRHHLPRLSSECRHAGRAGPADVQHDAGLRRAAVTVRHHGSPHAAQGTLGRLVRHGQQRRGRAHRQQRARARRPAEPRARLGERTLRAGRLPRHDERHRRADGVLASDLHDQPDDARGVGSARRAIRGCTRRLSPSRERTPASPRS